MGMSLKFSLLRLLVGVTAVCVICAVAAAFPAHFVAIGLRIAMFVPALVIAALFTVVSSRKARLAAKEPRLRIVSKAIEQDAG